jgi:hypothetical protein
MGYFVMSFSKGALAGFATGLAIAVVFAQVRVPRPAFLITADKKERLNKKEAPAALLEIQIPSLFDPVGDNPKSATIKETE